MASLQLPAKYPQLPALLNSQIETLIWCIEYHLRTTVYICLCSDGKVDTSFHLS